ncbi:Alpha/Beta hydrolase protein [Lentinula raphanica]|uniref:Alpha/Beta hydrolase protein n=1 Tax=Lentinula raphanica TaxID=153919 RepID=A0AA38PCP3_9AGAR|nr:Alpha/Beta hydrolase protein [Lentinula raphanica]
MATLVVNAIRRELGVNLSMSEFYREPTVKAIASLVTAGKNGKTTSSTTSFYDGIAGVPSTTIMANEDGPAPTIFMFPEVTGFASVYATAFENIQHRVVVFGDENWGKPFEERESIQDLARDYLQKVRAIQQSGPYHLAGWSFGGYLAFEVARQMQEAGEDVAILMMFDSYVYHEPLRMVEWTDDLHHLLQVNDDKPAWIAQFNRVRTLISKYEGPKESYRGKAVLVKALRIAKEDAEDYPHPENPYNGWREYIPRIERRSIEATHRTMFSLQNGQKMGKMISEIMMSI